MTEASRLANSEVKASIPNSLTLPKVQFFSWFLIWKIPSLKLLKNIVSCDENWELDSASVVQLFSTTRNTRNREWIVLFPEVNIWTRSDADTQNTMWQKYYLPQLTNVLYPRFSGTINTLSALRSTAFTRLYDVTILYSRKTHDWDELDGPGMEGVFKPPSLLEILCSKPSTFKIHIHVKARLTSRLPVKRRRMEKWIEKTWFEKDILLETMKQESLAETQPLPLP
ncbi:unnamed protein product [Kuraishia capsulata CBS 1993]|uniref:Acyltransferase C-terminal domain-containing protein n=1 Tax=Kuraishia capsulata CBS 1993 TaxID=1382522 RepID=W6MXD9_9ASCO|nr:uncharacterized protein KUCA_T00004704001 [Kuraishia capsulata CBS 1993]CDK28720.1 unnamed protein product [Kuraishia capsulata CBS 1993]